MKKEVLLDPEIFWFLYTKLCKDIFLTDGVMKMWGICSTVMLVLLTTVLAQSTQISMEIEISNSPLYFDQLFIHPDDAELKNGVFEIVPFPGEIRNITVYADIRDTNGFTDIARVVLIFNGTNVSMEQKFVGDVSMGFYEGRVPVPFYYEPGDDTIIVMAQDSGGATVNGTINISILPMVSLSLDTTALSLKGTTLEPLTIQGDEDITTVPYPTLENVGNVPLRVQLKGNDFFDGTKRIEAAAWVASLDAKGFNSSSVRLDYTSQDMGVVIEPNKVAPLWLMLDTTEGIAAGHYRGNISIVGVVS